MQMAKQRSKSKKKKTTSSKPMITRGAPKPMSLQAGASKKFKRAKIQTNTIQHDAEAVFNPRRTNSQRRPQTAKQPKKSAFTAGGKVKQVVAGTPINRMKSAKGSQMQASSTHQMMIPKQSQMFTSFGQQAISHRKGSSNPRKKYNSIYGTNNLKQQKKARASF